jgi:N-acetyltransferase
MTFDFQPHLYGELVSMRPMNEADFEPLYAVASDPLIWTMHPTHERWQRPVFRATIDEAFAEKGGLVAINTATGAIIGFSRYSQIAAGPNEIEIGWSFLARDYWGGRHNRDMKSIMVTHALSSFERVIFRVGETNIRSRRAMEKIGGVRIAWDEILTIFDRKAVYIAYEIRRIPSGAMASGLGPPQGTEPEK